MEAVPLLPKAKLLPNLDVAPLIREIFQDEFQKELPSKKISKNILSSLGYCKEYENDQESYKSGEILEKFFKRRENVVEFNENVLKAHKNHFEELEEIKNAEKHLFEIHTDFLDREKTLLENQAMRNLLSLKRQPLFKSLDQNFVAKYKLLQGDVGLPPEHVLKTDFRVQNFKSWRNNLDNINENNCFMNFTSRRNEESLGSCRKLPKKRILLKKKEKTQKIPAIRPKSKKVEEKTSKIFKADPASVFFTDYKLGDIYIAEVTIKNIHSSAVNFQIKPTNPSGPFKVMMNDRGKTTVSPGLNFSINIEFNPNSLDNEAEDVFIVTEDGNRFLIPLIAYLEPPVLKTHRDIDEFTKNISEKIVSSYVECGTCFTGDTKVTKVTFQCYQGSGEFFIMSAESWERSYVNTVTVENLLEIPPFRVYPVFFKVEKNQIIDLFVEFVPKSSGTHVENIVIACDNGQTRTLDLIGDAAGWHSYYFTFQDALLKELPVNEDDDPKVKYYLDFEDLGKNGKMEKVFCVSNNSNLAFDFQWKIRESNIFVSQEKYLKLSKDQVKIDPESGTFEPHSIWEFLVTITFSNAEIGNYRMVLSLYVLNLPYQCIEEDDTIIQPTGFVRNLYSQSLYGEEESSALTPELASLQGTYESLQESIKSYVESQNKLQIGPRFDFCKTTCIPNPGLCAKPLKKSKTFVNIGDNMDEVCACRHRQEPESNSESCVSNTRDDRTELSPPRNEVIWDFVDILVDEVELWAEVSPSRVSLEPSVVQLSKPLSINEKVFKEVHIINHNQSPAVCSWLTPFEFKSKRKNSDESSNIQTSFALLFKSENEDQKIQIDPLYSIKHSRIGQSERDDKGNYFDQDFENNKNSKQCKISTEPQRNFTVPGLSKSTCMIEIFACKPGKIEEELCLSINDGELELNLLIFGTITTKSLEIHPEILDFGVLKQGTRYTKDFKIINKQSNKISWKINQFQFDFKKEKFLSHSDTKDSEHLTKKKNSIRNKENSKTECYSLDARVPGIKCSILEIENENVKSALTVEKHYILVMGDVKFPEICLSSPKFENAILAPTGKIYVGQKISTRVTLVNVGNVETFVTWGHPFGCHCRKIKVEISPKSCRIQKKNRLTVSIDLTALEEGIISHCYVPCFFCRSAEPLILSIVAVADNLNVTFEIIDYPLQTHADPTTLFKIPFYNTVLRIPWPTKSYDPTLGLNYINENEIQQMTCHCRDVDDEAIRAFGEPPHLRDSLQASENTVRSLRSFDIVSKNNLKKSNSLAETGKTNSSKDPNMFFSAPESKKSEENSIVTYSLSEPPAENIQFTKFPLEFLNVPYRTPILRKFAIRNESPLETNFQINVATYGMTGKLRDKRLLNIKKRVFTSMKDDFQEKLMNDQPLVIVVEPTCGELKPLDAVCIHVYCYGNTWGEYRDELICQINGLEPYRLKMFIQILGHPIYFPMFKSQELQKPTLRFQSITFNESPITKHIKVGNRSAIPLSILWFVFLTQPLLKCEETEDSSLNINSNIDSNPSGEESIESLKNYIPKNASKSASTFPNSIDGKDLSQHSEIFKSPINQESSLSISKEKGNLSENEKSEHTILSSESLKMELQQTLPGRYDNNIFKVEPKEMFFEPLEEKNMKITFDPRFSKPDGYPADFLGVLTGCVRLKPEDEKQENLYYRPCGLNFVSQLMDFNALVEIPLLTFELLRGDCRFIVDSNEISKSKSKRWSCIRTYLLKNKNEKSISVTIEVIPGLIFKVKSVNTFDKFYPEYQSQIHTLKIEPGHVLELELECFVTFKDVMYAYEDLKRSSQKNLSPDSSEIRVIKSSIDNFKQIKNAEPWTRVTDDNEKQKEGSLSHKDSLQLNVHRMSSKSNNSSCDPALRINEECEGEYLFLPKFDKMPCEAKLKHFAIIQEELSFVQSELTTQTLVVELRISFPALKISTKSLDFGNVYLNETAVRYFSIINLTGFPTDFRVMAKTNAAEFTASPLTGSLRSRDYNADIGETITINFIPSKPGYFKEVYHIYSNLDLLFDHYELFVSGFGTWNEKYRSPKFETINKLEGVYQNICI